MVDDSRARLIAYLCQAGLSTARASAVLDQHMRQSTEKQADSTSAYRAQVDRAERAERRLTELQEAARQNLCPNCMLLEEQRTAANERARHNGEMYEQAKDRWHEAGDALTRVRDTCDAVVGDAVPVADVRAAATIRPLPTKEWKP